ncbi:hypothetical protein [Streptomyces adonidis]|uniref:hypothetical protein n=1 Tax=Streptomyces adonidis TaxID=3231367 RepID=UPI0034DB2FA2
MTTFHSWDEVKEEVFDAEDLDKIAAGAPREGVPGDPPYSSGGSVVADITSHLLAGLVRTGNI